jgi:hypothetical protein
VQSDHVRGRRAGIARKEKADRQIALLGDIEIDRVADHQRTGRNGAGSLAAEQQRVVRRGGDGRAFTAPGDVRRADHEGRLPHRIGDCDADTAAADAGMDRHPDSLIVESLRQLHRRCW